MTAKEKIEKIQIEAAEKIESLKAERVTELTEEIRAAKKAVKAAEKVLNELEEEKAELTGKKAKQAASASPFLSEADAKALAAKVLSLVKAAGPDGIAATELAEKTNSSSKNIKTALAANEGITTTGKARGTRYHVK